MRSQSQSLVALRVARTRLQILVAMSRTNSFRVMSRASVVKVNRPKIKTAVRDTCPSPGLLSLTKSYWPYPRLLTPDRARCLIIKQPSIRAERNSR